MRREIEINAGFQPLKHTDVGGLIPVYVDWMPPKTTLNHKHVVERILLTFLHLHGRKRRDGSRRLQTQQVAPQKVDRFIRRRVGHTVFEREPQ